MDKDMANKPRILVVDDETDNLKALERTLRREFDVVASSDPVQAAGQISEDAFAVILTDQKMPAMTGTELLAKAATVSPNTTRMILTAFTDTKLMLEAINRAEIYRYITKPWDNDALLVHVRQAAERFRLVKDNQALVHNLEHLVEARTKELRAVNERLSFLARTDSLTKVYNRRAFFEKFSEELERSARYSRPLVVVMLDVDHFKAFNDMEGHICGDEALKRIAQILTTNKRKSDAVARYGGEEFIMMMPETTKQNAVDMCERLRLAVEETRFQGREEGAFLTVSLGVSEYPTQGESMEQLIEAADQALYQAKKAGRNQVVG